MSYDLQREQRFYCFNILKDTFAVFFFRKMEKPPIQKTRRALTLSKPAPRKKYMSDGITDNKCTVITEDNNCAVITEGVVSIGANATEKQGKENTPFKKRASRGLKLEKPAPLKSSKVNSTGKVLFVVIISFFKLSDVLDQI